MKLSTKQAGQKLGCHHSTVANLIKTGKLHDVSGKEGRHEYEIDSKELNEFSKTWSNRRSRNRKVILMDNGGPAIPYNEDINKPMPKLLTQLNRIEAKLDTLLRIWS